VLYTPRQRIGNAWGYAKIGVSNPHGQYIGILIFSPLHAVAISAIGESVKIDWFRHTRWSILNAPTIEAR
jgi:hypothetical protein